MAIREPASDAVPEAFLDLGGEATRDGLEVGVEQRAVPAQGLEHLPPRAGGGLGVDYEGTRSRGFCSINYGLD